MLRPSAKAGKRISLTSPFGNHDLRIIVTALQDLEVAKGQKMGLSGESTAWRMGTQNGHTALVHHRDKSAFHDRKKAPRSTRGEIDHLSPTYGAVQQSTLRREHTKGYMSK